MRAITTLLIALTAQASAYDRFPSPNKQLEAYTTANYADGSGMKLFVRLTRSDQKGVVLFSNERWIDAKWSPDSGFLAVIDHANGHVSDVYVFGIMADNERPLRTVLYYHTPKPFTYNVKWDVASWMPSQRSVVLSKQVRDEEAHTTTRTQMIARIGTKSLILDQPILR